MNDWHFNSVYSVHSILTVSPTSNLFAEERYHNWCWGFRAGCCTTAAKLRHSGNCWGFKLVAVTHLRWSPTLPCLLVTVLSLYTLYFHWFTGGGARGKGENWRSCVGWYFSGCHCWPRSSNCQWLCEQPHRPDVWTGMIFLRAEKSVKKYSISVKTVT